MMWEDWILIELFFWIMLDKVDDIDLFKKDKLRILLEVVIVLIGIVIILLYLI